MEKSSQRTIIYVESNPYILTHTGILKISTCDTVKKINRLKVHCAKITHCLKISYVKIKFYEINCFKNLFQNNLLDVLKIIKNYREIYKWKFLRDSATKSDSARMSDN